MTFGLTESAYHQHRVFWHRKAAFPGRGYWVMLTLERSLSLGLHDQMRRICFNMEMVKVQVAQISEPSREQSGGQKLILQGSQQAKVPQLPRNEDKSFEAPEIDPSLDILAAAPRLSQPQSPGSDALARPYAAAFDLIRNICEQDCSCTCHRGGRFRSPRYLSSVFGSLLIGYTAQSRMSCICDSYDCRGRSTCITYTYAFPRWLLDRTVAFRIAYDRSRGPELCVRLFRVRSSRESIFLVGHNYRIGHVQGIHPSHKRSFDQRRSICT